MWVGKSEGAAAIALKQGGGLPAHPAVPHAQLAEQKIADLKIVEEKVALLKIFLLKGPELLLQKAMFASF